MSGRKYPREVLKEEDGKGRDGRGGGGAWKSGSRCVGGVEDALAEMSRDKGEKSELIFAGRYILRAGKVEARRR